MSRTGANVPAAIEHLAEAGYPVCRIAEDLGVARSTVYRWRAGRCQPSARNFAALVQRVDTWYSTEVHRRRLTVASVHLRDAADALVTDAQRAEDERLAAEVREHLEAGQRRREAEASRQPYRSITRDIDPFALAGEPEQPLPF